MQAVGDGYFHAIVEDVAAGALYRYRLNDEKERPDPASRYQPEGVHGPSQIIDGRFSWKDSGWHGLPLESYVLYELHVGMFTAKGTFDAITPRLTTLKDLGVTAIDSGIGTPPCQDISEAIRATFPSTVGRPLRASAEAAWAGVTMAWFSRVFTEGRSA